MQATATRRCLGGCRGGGRFSMIVEALNFADKKWKETRWYSWQGYSYMIRREEQDITQLGFELISALHQRFK